MPGRYIGFIPSVLVLLIRSLRRLTKRPHVPDKTPPAGAAAWQRRAPITGSLARARDGAPGG
jgi:hypothetical protein